MKTAKRKREKPTRGPRGRNPATREEIQRFLIVCEGERTEPHYFEAFRVLTRPHIVKVEGAGANTIKVVERAITLRAKDGEYDQVWCVFDRDDFPTEHFKAALTLAEKVGISVAYSNEAFELWYLLHFDFHHAQLHRSQYKEKLSKRLGHPYEKNSTTIYEELKDRQGTALKNAAQLLAQYERPNPANDNPSTTVHLLVEQLNRFIR